MIINNFGTYESLDAVWESYPTGGIEGAYVYIHEQVFVWDKYIMAWREATEEDLQEGNIEATESSDAPIATYENKGSFASIEEVWEVYPQGGIEGSSVTIGGDTYVWNKYNSNWEMTEEDLVSRSTYSDISDATYRLVVCIGQFEDVKEVWEAYPTGGIEGTYVFVGEEKYRWDKYSNSWVIATEQESSTLRPIVVTSQEGVVEYSDNYINYLGSFDTLEEVWEIFPEGGREGDYILVAGEKLKWNKYTATWGEVEDDPTSELRAVAKVYGDLEVYNDLIVGDRLVAAILDKLATRLALSKLTPKRVESEEAMEQMIATGNYDAEQIYYIPE
jgi:hypothetical protein